MSVTLAAVIDPNADWPNQAVPLIPSDVTPALTALSAYSAMR